MYFIRHGEQFCIVFPQHNLLLLDNTTKFWYDIVLYQYRVIFIVKGVVLGTIFFTVFRPLGVTLRDRGGGGID